MQPNPEFEADIRAAMAVPEPDPAFLSSLRRQVSRQRATRATRVAWIGLAASMIFLWVVIWIVGPETVFAEFRSLFGYIPGVGLVQNDASLRILAEPVKIERDGITVSVNRAVLTIDRTHVDFGVSGVPLSAYPKNEAITGCREQSYLRLPNGAKSDLIAPLPGSVNEAVFVMPCIFNTLNGTTPLDWELPLKFVPAPPELTVMPVIEPTQTLLPTATQPAVHATSGPTSTPAKPLPVVLTIDKFIQTSDGYILIGAIRIQDKSITGIQQKGVLVLRDANGKKVAYTHPQDLNNQMDWSDDNVKPFAIQFQAAGITFPLIIDIPGAMLSEADPQAVAEFVFDAGDNPQPGQKWTLNQDIQLAGKTLKLAFVRIDSRNRYYFGVNVAENIDSVGVDIKGMTAGGHGMSGYSQGQIGTSVSFAEMPTGKLTFVFSHLVVAGETQVWQTQWQPDGQVGHLPTATPPAYPVCLKADSIDKLPPLPDGLDGRALLTEMTPDLKLVIASLNGGQRQELPLQSSRGAFSPDGQKVAYPTSEGIAILDLAINTTNMLKGQMGFGLTWSPDGTQLAYVTSSNPYGVFITSVSGGSTPTQLSTLGDEALAGWSPDGRLIYYAIPGTNSDGSFLLRAVDVNSGATRDVLTLDNSSRKAPLPKVSPDGKWVAYRASDNSSLFIKAMDDKSPARLLIDNPGMAVSGIAWDKKTHLLGVSLVGNDNQNGVIILLQPDGCEAYRLHGLKGELNGIFIP